MKVSFLPLCIGVLVGADILRTLWLFRQQGIDTAATNVRHRERPPAILFRALQILGLTVLLLILDPASHAANEHAQYALNPNIHLVLVFCAVLALTLQGILAFRLHKEEKNTYQPNIERYAFPSNARFDEEWAKNPQYYDLNGLRLRMLALPHWQTKEQDFQDSHIVLEGAIMLSVLSGSVTWTRASRAFDITLKMFDEMNLRSEWAKLISDSTRITSSTAETNKGSSKRYPELIEKMECFLVVGTMTKISAKLAQPFAPAVYRRVKIFDNTEKAILGALQDFIPQRNGKSLLTETITPLPTSYHEQRIMEIYSMLAKISDAEPNTIEVPDIPPDDMYYDVFRAMSVVNDDKRRQMDTLLRQQEMLQVQGAEIQEANTMLSERLEQLNEQNHQLAQLNHEKNELMSIVAHDLKNPIGVVRSFAELIENQMVKGEAALQVSRQIIQTSDRMIDLVKNLLEINRLESGAIQLNIQAFDIASVVESSTWHFSPQADTKNITLHCINEADHSIAYADEQALAQVVDNLVSNAVKYSPWGKNIVVRIKQHNQAVRIQVEDQGPGISDEDMKRLFEKFARLSAQPTGGENSTGLGLSIVKKMVEGMNGKVWCESELGKGARFIVELPMAQI